MSLGKCVLSCTTYHNQDIEHFHHLKKFVSSFLQLILFPSHPLATADLLYVIVVFLEFNINGIIHYVVSVPGFF